MILISLLLGLLLFYFCLPKPLFNQHYSTVVYDRHHELLNARIADDGQWRFPSNNYIPPKFEKCLLEFEDHYFYRHPGINITNTMYSVKRIFIVQLVLIAALFISFIVRDILIKIEFEITCFHDIVIIFSNAFAIAVFLYFLEALYDVGQTVYSLIDYNGSNNNK